MEEVYARINAAKRDGLNPDQDWSKLSETEGFNVYDPSEQSLPFNPLAPAVDPRSGRVNPTHHIHQLTDIIKRIYRLGDQQAYRLREAMKRTADAARRAGKWAGCVAATAPALKMAVELGYQLIFGGADVVFLRTGAAEKLNELRAALGGQAVKKPEPRGSGIYGG